MGQFEGDMYAIFLMKPQRMAAIIVQAEETMGDSYKVKVYSHGNGGMCQVQGPIHSIMFIIGDVAAQGENCLYKAECL